MEYIYVVESVSVKSILAGIRKSDMDFRGGKETESRVNVT
jgi:hypothetical protein